MHKPDSTLRYELRPALHDWCLGHAPSCACETIELASTNGGVDQLYIFGVVDSVYSREPVVCFVCTTHHS